MRKRKLTPFYPGEIMPVWVGVYETLTQLGNEIVRFRYWNGKHWCVGAPNPKVAMLWKSFPLANHFPAWRGLTEPAK